MIPDLNVTVAPPAQPRVREGEGHDEFTHFTLLQLNALASASAALAL